MGNRPDHRPEVAKNLLIGNRETLGALNFIFASRDFYESRLFHGS